MQRKQSIALRTESSGAAAHTPRTAGRQAVIQILEQQNDNSWFTVASVYVVLRRMFDEPHEAPYGLTTKEALTILWNEIDSAVKERKAELRRRKFRFQVNKPRPTLDFSKNPLTSFLGRSGQWQSSTLVLHPHHSALRGRLIRHWPLYCCLDRPMHPPAHTDHRSAGIPLEGTWNVHQD